MADLFTVAGRNTVATGNGKAQATLWNPAANRSLYVTYVSYFSTIDNSDMCTAMVRSTARGTAANTVTPVQQNSDNFLAAPRTAAVLDLSTYSVEPTLASATAFMYRFRVGGLEGPGQCLDLRLTPIEVPAGTGLTFVITSINAVDAFDFTFNWRE